MRIGKTVFFTTFFFFVTVAALYAADVAKIGVVDFQRILEISSAGKSAVAKIEKQGEKMKAQLMEKGAEIKEIQKKLERETLVMSKEMRDEKQREVRIKINDFKILEKKYRSEFQQIENRLVTRIKKDIFELVDTIGKREGYLLIIEKREAGVLYIPKAIDLTDKLIQQYNKKYGEKAGKEKG
ncbi:MAG: OmpH family outer membrane protein [Deltaproteobacteria bacterium]|nr:OmpH family outer membrane protein [Deltaproteobacteria bacterium]MBW2660933.1 OmpH family outer membrane protein [Deltaproteobacteria bacterium]